MNTLLPSRSAGRRRDRHARGLRGPLMPALYPAAQTRREEFTQLLVATFEELVLLAGEQAVGVELAIEEVPPSDPAPWERGEVAVARFFPPDRTHGWAPRIVVYRLAVVTRLADLDLPVALREIISEQLVDGLGVPRDRLEPGAP